MEKASFSCYIVICKFMQNESQLHKDKQTSEVFFIKYILLIYFKGLKRVTQGFMVRGSWRPNRTAIYWPPLYGRQRCVFLVLLMLNQRPGGSILCWMMAFFTASYPQLVSKTPSEVPRAPSAGCGFPYHILSATSLDPNSSGASRAPSAWCGFPYLISSLTPTVTVWLFVLTELYNSSMPTQSPTRSLGWHVWSSSSGNNCHAVHRSLSSGTSVYECTMGILAYPILLANFRPRDFLS